MLRILSVHNEPALAGVRIAALHSRLDTDATADTMAAFAAGDVDLLVSIAVIEVGVDAHNATLMAVLDADRSGISQLHQLRGRLGRGPLPGTCLLVTSLGAHPSIRRLDAVCQRNAATINDIAGRKVVSVQRSKVASFLECLAPNLAAAAVVVLERSTRSAEPTWPAAVECFVEKKGGETRLWFAEPAGT